MFVICSIYKTSDQTWLKQACNRSRMPQTATERVPGSYNASSSPHTASTQKFESQNDRTLGSHHQR